MISNLSPQSATSLHSLRDALEQAERQIVRLDRTNIQSFLLLLDQIEQMWTQYDDPGAIRAEDARWQSLLKRIATTPQLLTSAATQAGGLTKLRSQHPPATGLWWHVDEQVAGRRSRMWQRLALALGLLLLALVAFWLVNNVMARTVTPNGAGVSQQIEPLIAAQNWQEARTVVASARQNAPDDLNLLVWEAVLAEQLGDDDQAQTSLSQAQATFVGPPANFWMLVGDLRLQAGNWAGAEEAGQQALTLAPDDAQVTFLLGRVAEARGDLPQASEYFNQTITLAGDSDPELVALVKVRMGYQMQGVDPLPSLAPKPDSTPGQAP